MITLTQEEINKHETVVESLRKEVRQLKTENKLLFDMTIDWNSIDEYGPPPCDGEKWFIGTNEQGMMCCFNHLDDTGMCWYCGPEEHVQLMNGLSLWAKIEPPVITD